MQSKSNIDNLLYNYNIFHRYFYLDNYLSAVIFQQKLTDSAISINNMISMVKDRTLLIRSNPIDINLMAGELASMHRELEKDFKLTDFEFIYHDILELTIENIKDIISEINKSDPKKIISEINEKIFDGIKTEISEIMFKFLPDGPDELDGEECANYILEPLYEILSSGDQQKKTISEMINEFITLFILVNIK